MRKFLDFWRLYWQLEIFLNNPNKLGKGFEVTSISKLINIKTVLDKDRTLLHVVGQMIYEKDPELLDFLDCLDNLDAVFEAMMGFDDNFRELSNLLVKIKNILTIFQESNLNQGSLKAAFENACQKGGALTEQYNNIKQQLKFFGYAGYETQPAEFFDLWAKFVESFTISLNYNLSVIEVDEAKKIQEKKEKEKEKKNCCTFSSPFKRYCISFNASNERYCPKFKI